MKRLISVICIAQVLSPGIVSAQVASQGEWETPVFDFGDLQLEPIGPVHLIHVYDGTRGKVIAITAETTQSCPGGALAAGRTRLWSFPLNGAPGPGTFEAIPLCRSYTFCGGHSSLADGRVLVVGGGEHSVGTNQANLFDPDLPVGFQWNLFQPPDDMAAGRWYPTATTLPDGRVLVCSGNVNTPERFDPATNAWTLLTSATLAQSLYPYMFVLPDGNLVDAGPADARILVTSNWTWSNAVLPDPDLVADQPARPDARRGWFLRDV